MHDLPGVSSLSDLAARSVILNCVLRPGTVGRQLEAASYWPVREASQGSVPQRLAYKVPQEFPRGRYSRAPFAPPRWLVGIRKKTVPQVGCGGVCVQERDCTIRSCQRQVNEACHESATHIPNLSGLGLPAPNPRRTARPTQSTKHVIWVCVVAKSARKRTVSSQLTSIRL
jgi:hypothetical protein